MSAAMKCSWVFTFAGWVLLALAWMMFGTFVSRSLVAPVNLRFLGYWVAPASVAAFAMSLVLAAVGRRNGDRSRSAWAGIVSVASGWGVWGLAAALWVWLR